MRSTLVSWCSLVLFSFGALTIACGSEESVPDETTEPKTTPDRKPTDKTAGEDNASGAAAPAAAPATDPTAPTQTPPSSQEATCQTARDLGPMSGDTGTPSMTTQGKCSEWVRLRITEDQTSALAAGEKLTVTLVPPTGADFDLRVHMTAEADVVDCVTPKATSIKEGDKTETVKLSWGEVYSGNNADDSRNVAIEVRSKDGKCAAQTWTLLVQGNQ